MAALTLEAKRPWREAKQSPQSSAKVKNEWSYYSIPLNYFMATTGTILHGFQNYDVECDFIPREAASGAH
jgi:hypothetical protein